MARSAAETRAQLLEVAGELFYWKGVRATGVDLVAAKSGVAPTTLYRLFGSKDGLVAAYVELWSEEGKRRWTAAVEAAGPDPAEKILALFDAVCAHIESGEFRGCPMLLTLAEFPDDDLPAHQLAVAGKTWIRGFLGDLAAELDVDRPARLGDQLALVLEGVFASGQALGADGPVKQTRHLVQSLLAVNARSVECPDGHRKRRS